MKGVTTNGVKKASSIIDKLKFRTIYKDKDIHLIPESGKPDGTLIWLHGLGDTAEEFLEMFRERASLGVYLLNLNKFLEFKSSSFIRWRLRNRCRYEWLWIWSWVPNPWMI